MDNLWSRRSNTGKLSLSTGAAAANGAPPATDRYVMGRRHGDSSSHGNKNPFNHPTPSTSSISSPVAGASSAFGLGSGAFASFGASKTPKTPATALDFGSIVGVSAKTPNAEKQVRDLIPKPSKTSLTGSKSTPSPAPTHGLRHSWVFWFRPPISKSNGFVEYEKTLHPIACAETVEDFFSIYAHLKRPSTLPLVSDYHLFKSGVRPIWEDDDNKRGGKWIVRLKKGVSDRYWEELLLAVIGDQFADAGDELCGVVLSVRNGEDILSIWTSNDGGRVLKIRETMKRVLGFPPETKVEWKSHDDSIQQRTAIDDARKDKSDRHGHHSSGPSRNNSKDDYLTHPDKKQAS